MSERRGSETTEVRIIKHEEPYNRVEIACVFNQTANSCHRLYANVSKFSNSYFVQQFCSQLLAPEVKMVDVM